VKLVARAIAVASIVLGFFLVTRTYVLESRYASEMPRSRDPSLGRLNPVLVSRQTQVYVTDAEVKILDTSRTYVTFGWPFVILGVLLAAASRERRPLGAAPESDSQWSARP
jgi:hypothetical protein